MLFNSYIFVFLFLPVALIGFWWSHTKFNRRVALTWLVASSLFYYGFWNPVYLLLIFASIGFNYGFAYALSRESSGGGVARHCLA